MADLSQLSDEQLGVYRDLIAKKQGVPGMEQLGGTPPPAGKAPTLPPAMSIPMRALMNTPRSLQNYGTSLLRDFGPSSGPRLDICQGTVYRAYRIAVERLKPFQNTKSLPSTSQHQDAA